MTLHEEQKKVQKAMESALSGLQEDPWLTQRVLANVKGEEPVKKKLSAALVLCIVLGLAIIGTACAVLSSSRVAEFFGRHWGGDLENWIQGGKVAQIGETVSLGGVDFTLDEVVYRNRTIYGVGTARVRDARDVLLPMDLADSWDMEEVTRGEEAQALIRRARESGGRLLSIDCYPQRIGVDNGSMVQSGDIGVYNVRNENGSLTFSFETGGYALEDGKTYQLELSVDVDEWTESGMVEDDRVKSRTWTVGFEPVIMEETAEPEAATPVPVDAVPHTGFEILVPPVCQETGTLPVRRAVENDFTAVVRPEWFNRSGIAREESNRSVSLTFNDHAELSVSPEAIYYAEYTDELFDYNWKERETEDPDLEPMMMPRQALSQGIAGIASGVYFGYPYSGGVTLEHEQLTLISLEDAKRTAEQLFEKLGLQGYELAWALDMDLERIHTLGEAYNRFWYEGDAYSNAPRQDYSAATVEDEGYYLVYTPLGVTNVSDGRHQISLFISSRGIVRASIVSTYRQGDVASVPEKLISPEEAVTRLYTEAADSRDHIEVQSVERVALTYVAVRAENKQEGMVFVPAWQVLYREAGESEEYTGWAEFNAINGSLIDAVFR